MCKQKPYPVWFLCQRKSYLVWYSVNKTLQYPSPSPPPRISRPSPRTSSNTSVTEQQIVESVFMGRFHCLLNFFLIGFEFRLLF